jgi:hypothetical protein
MIQLRCRAWQLQPPLQVQSSLILVLPVLQATALVLPPLIDCSEAQSFLRSPLCGAEPLVCPCSVLVVVVVVVVAYILGSYAALSSSLHPVPLPISLF